MKKYAILVVCMLCMIACAATVYADAVVSSLPTEIITEATYPVTAGENPSVAKERVYISAMRLAHAKWVEAIGKLPAIAAKNYSIAQLYVAVEAMNRPTLVEQKTVLINGDKYYWVKASNKLDLGNLNIVSENMTATDYVPLIRSIHKVLDSNSASIADLRLQYIYSGSEVDKTALKKKIVACEAGFVSCENEFYGFVAFIHNNLAASLSYLDAAIMADSDNVGAFYARGLYFQATNQPEKAIADYTRVIQANPSAVDAYSRRAKMYVAVADFNSAVADYSVCLEAAPGQVALYTDRADLYVKLNQNMLALNDYNKAVALQPDNYPVFVKRAAVLVALKEYDEAIKSYSQLLAKDAQNVNYLLARAKCYFDKGDIASALTDYKLAMSLGENKPDVFLTIANISYTDKQYNQAIEALVQYFALVHSDAQAYSLAGKCYDAVNNPAAAIDSYSKAIAIQPNDTLVLMSRARDYYALASTNPGYYSLASADCTNVLRLDDKFYEAYNLRGKVYQYQKDYKGALLDYNACLAIKIQADTYNRIGECYQALGDKNKPRQYFGAAIKLEPTNPQYYLNLAKFFDAIGRAKSDTIMAYQDFVNATGSLSAWTDQVTTVKARMAQLGSKG